VRGFEFSPWPIEGTRTTFVKWTSCPEAQHLAENCLSAISSFEDSLGFTTPLALNRSSVCACANAPASLFTCSRVIIHRQRARSRRTSVSYRHLKRCVFFRSKSQTQ